MRNMDINRLFFSKQVPEDDESFSKTSASLCKQRTGQTIQTIGESSHLKIFPHILTGKKQLKQGNEQGKTAFFKTPKS